MSKKFLVALDDDTLFVIDTGLRIGYDEATLRGMTNTADKFDAVRAMLVQQKEINTTSAILMEVMDKADKGLDDVV